MNAPEVDDKAWLPDCVETGQASPEPKFVEPNFGLNDSGNADRLAAVFGNELMYCRERKSFYAWTGTHWEFDEFLEAEKYAETTIRSAFAQAGAINDEKGRKAFLAFLNRSLSRNGLANMVHLAKKKVRVISATELDRDPWLLNVRNGTLDLKNGVLKPHQREDLISKLIPIDYIRGAPCPLFKGFIYRIMGDEMDAPLPAKERAHQLVTYLQRLFGCGATGKPEKILAIFYGQRGNNGKTTLLTIISKALGDREYAAQINIDSLMADPRGAGSNNAVNADLADLQGARFVFTSEVEKAHRLSLGRVKYLTGQTAIKTRRMRENWITFAPTHKIFMDCNDRPVIATPTDAVWNRLICVPFEVVIPDEEIDPDFGSKLETELAGILSWIVEGAHSYCRDGLRGFPDEVKASTDEYRRSSDRLQDFIDDCCYLNQFAWVKSDQLFAAYEEHCKRNGEKHPLEGRDFTDQLRSRGCSPKSKEIKGKAIRGWAGIELKQASAE